MDIYCSLRLSLKEGGVSPFTGRFFIMTLRKRLHTRRGGGGGCVGRGRLRRPRPVPQSPGLSRHGRGKRPHPSSQPPPPLRDDSASLLVSKKPPCERGVSLPPVLSVSKWYVHDT